MLAADGVRGGRRGCWLEIAPETGTTAWAVRCGWDREGIAWLGCASPSINQEFVPSMYDDEQCGTALMLSVRDRPFPCALALLYLVARFPVCGSCWKLYHTCIRTQSR